MAATITDLANGTGTSSATTITTGATVTVVSGDWLVVLIAHPNETTVGSVVDSGGSNTYTERQESAYFGGGAGGGVNVAIYTCSVSSSVTNGTITANLTLGGSPTATTARTIQVYRVRPSGSEIVSYIGGGTHGGSNTTSHGTSAISVTNGDTIFALAGIETDDTVTGDSDTTNGSWSAIITRLADGGADEDATSNSSQYKTVSATGNQTWTCTTASARDSKIAHVIIRSAVVPKEVDALAGSYTLTGTAASLEHGWKIAAAGGSYAHTGTDATLNKGRTITAAGGSYAVTGTNASLVHAFKIAAAGGSYAVTGTNATLQKLREIAPEAGSYTYAGTNVTLTASGAAVAYSIVAGAGSYTLSPGSTVFLGLTSSVPGSYTVTGSSDVTFTVNEDTSDSVDGRPIIRRQGSYGYALDDDAARARQAASDRRARKAVRDAKRLDDMIAAYMEGRQYIELPDRDPEDPVEIANVAAQLAAPPWARISFLEGALEAVQEKRAIMQAAQQQRVMQQEMEEDDVSALSIMD